MVPSRSGALLRHLDPFLYGNGLCFGMVVAALREFSKGASGRSLPELPLSRELLEELFILHARQYRPGAVFVVVREWMRSGGGKPDGFPKRLRFPGSGDDPHILCFGPGVNRRFLRCMRNAHAVAPYRVESLEGEARVYVYDPNYPKSRSRYVSFGADGGFRYGGFASEGGWGITLLSLSAIGERPT